MRRAAFVVAFAMLLGVLAIPGAAAPLASPPAANGAAGAAAAQRFIVTLRTPAAASAGLDARALTAERATIAAHTDEVARRLGSRGHVVRRFHTMPYAVVEASAAEADALRRAPEVASVEADTPLPAADSETTPLVGATALQAALVNGNGQAVAVLDTGVDATHPFLSGKTVDQSCFAASATCPNGRTSQLGGNAAVPCPFAPTDCRHGTHVAGIAVGGPALGVPFTGIAPGAKLVAVQVFSRFVDPVCSTVGKASPCALTLNSDMLGGLDHVADVAARFHVASVNMSIGGAVHTTPCDTNVLKPAIDRLRAINVATVIAAGNNARSDAISEPGCISSAISVGATDDTDHVASFSNSASFMKLWAPGVAVRSSVPGGGFADFNGTSMATPHVAAAFAVARQIAPNDSVGQILLRLRAGGVPVTDPRSGRTFPRLELLRGLGALQIVPGAAHATEGQTISLPVTLTRTSLLTITAHYQTMSSSATQGVDFVGKSGTVTFAPLQKTATIAIQTTADTRTEADETFLVAFSAPTNASIGGFFGLGGGQIIDND